MSKKQLFFPGDLVQIADELPCYMRHFDAGLKAIVIEANHSQTIDYSLYLIQERNTVAWYPQEVLTLIDGGIEHLKEIKKSEISEIAWILEKRKRNKKLKKQKVSGE